MAPSVLKSKGADSLGVLEKRKNAVNSAGVQKDSSSVSKDLKRVLAEASEQQKQQQDNGGMVENDGDTREDKENMRIVVSLN